MAREQKEKRDYRQEVTDRIIALMENGVAPWQRPWDDMPKAMPMNPVSGRAYRGGNALHLMATAMAAGYGDPRWMTFKQAQQQGYQVRKGEKASHIEYWKFPEAATKREVDHCTDLLKKAEWGKARDGAIPESVDRAYWSLKSLAEKDPAKAYDLLKKHGPQGREIWPQFKQWAERGVMPVQKTFAVFNAAQIDGIEPWQQQRPEWDAIKDAEDLVKASGARIIEHADGSQGAYYSPKRDEVHMPPRGAFKDAGAYYGVLTHELGHWTGHESRLNRQTLTEITRFGDPTYAKEELRAELTSVFLSAELGTPRDENRHAAYLQSWIKALKEDKNELFRAAKDASKAADFMVALHREKSVEAALAAVNERAAPSQQPQRETARHESSTTVAQQEPGTKTIRVQDKRTATEGAALDDNAQARGALAKSFQDSQQLAAKTMGEGVKVYAAQRDSGKYTGKIIGQTNGHILQQVSPRSAIAHIKQGLGDAQPGTNVLIAYASGNATVRQVAERERGRSHGRALSR